MRVIGSAIVTLAILTLGLSELVGHAGAAQGAVSGATLEWTVSEEANTGAFNGSCNFMSAGRSDGSAATYAAVNADVTVVKLNAANQYLPISDDATRCRDRNGATVTATGSNRLGQKVVYRNGVGTLDPTTGETTISWSGTFSLNFYGGLIPFWIEDPVLHVDATGSGTVTATVGGYSSSIDDPESREPLTPVPGVVIARFSGAPSANTAGFTVTPTYAGVTYESTAAPQNRVTPGWGSWPLPWVTVHEQTGLSGYWYSTGGAADARKAPAPIAIGYGDVVAPPTTTSTTSTTSTTTSTSTSTSVAPTPTSTTSTTTTTTVAGGGSGSVGIEAVVPTTTTTVPSGPGPDPGTGPEPDPDGIFQWTIDAADPVVTLSFLPGDADHLRFSGQLTPVTVTDTRRGTPAWSLSGQVSDFTGGVSGRYLGWTPTVTSSGAGAVAGPVVASGISSGNGLKNPSVLASAPAGHLKGTATVGAALDLRFPASTAPGTYRATLTITALG